MEFFKKLDIKAQKDGIIKKIVGGVIINSNGEILMLKRRADDFMGGIFELPSGNVELNEEISDALIREVKEETALEVSKIGMFINTFDYLSSSGKKSRQFNFEIKVNNTEDLFLTEHDEYKWMNFQEIENEEKITDEVKYVIDIYRYNNTI